MAAKRKRASRSRSRLRFAVVGLGHIAQAAVLPAFANAKRRCTLAALVSDEDEKLDRLCRKYRVDRRAGYDGLADLCASGEIDAIYVALPNDRHAWATLVAARAGVHVLCEKPLALTSAECERMIDACDAAGVRLMTAYRLHFERANLRAVEIVRKGRIGEPRFFDALFGLQVRDAENIRLDKARGGGPLFDLGVYCINAARYLFRDEPVEVRAMNAEHEDPRFREVPEATSALLRFPGDRLATFTCSFHSADVSTYRVVGTRGDVTLDPAFSYSRGLELRTTIGGRTTTAFYAKRDQFAPELLHFAEAVLDGKRLEPDGIEGWADVRVVEAIRESARTKRAVELAPFVKRTRPSLRQERRAPPVKKPEMVEAQSARRP
jgi:glucose-fructose oxidoreductase